MVGRSFNSWQLHLCVRRTSTSGELYPSPATTRWSITPLRRARCSSCWHAATQSGFAAALKIAGSLQQAIACPWRRRRLPLSLLRAREPLRQFRCIRATSNAWRGQRLTASFWPAILAPLCRNPPTTFLTHQIPSNRDHKTLQEVRWWPVWVCGV